MANVVIVVLLIACVGGACFYLYKSRKKGAKCIGCPCENSCSGRCGDK